MTRMLLIATLALATAACHRGPDPDEVGTTPGYSGGNALAAEVRAEEDLRRSILANQGDAATDALALPNQAEFEAIQNEGQAAAARRAAATIEAERSAAAAPTAQDTTPTPGAAPIYRPASPASGATAGSGNSSPRPGDPGQRANPRIGGSTVGARPYYAPPGARRDQESPQ